MKEKINSKLVFEPEFNKLFFPLLIEQFFMTLIGNVNVFLYSMLGDDIVASISLADQVLAIGSMAVGIIGLGTSILFLRNSDEGKLGYISLVARQGFLLNAILAFSLFALAIIFGRQIMGLMNTPESLFDSSVSYLTIASISLLFQGASAIFSAILRSFGKASQAMRVSIFNTILVIVGNSIAILTPMRDVFGAKAIAIATVTTRLLGLFVSFYATRVELPKLRFTFTSERKKRAKVQTQEVDSTEILEEDYDSFTVVKKILSLGIPSGMENVSYNFIQTVITAIIAGMGSVAVASKVYAQNITALVFSFGVAAGMSSQIITGKLIREKDKELEVFPLKTTASLMALCAALNLVLAILGPVLIRIFTKNDEIIGLVQKLLFLNVLYDPLRVGNEIMIANLNVCQDVKFPVFMAILVNYAFTLPAVLFFGGRLGLGLIAVWIIFISDEAIRFISFVIRWKMGSYKKFLTK